jgi:cysteine-rich repeat protein
MTATRIVSQITLVLLASLASTPASGAVEIACGETQRRTVLPQAADQAAFDAVAGEVVSIAAVGDLGGQDFDPRWQLYAPDGTMLGGCARRCVTGPLPRTGRYAISVTRSAGQPSGDYHLSLEAVSATANGVSNGPPVPTCQRGDDGTRLLTPGVPLDAAIDVPGETDTMVFVAPSDERAEITVTRGADFLPGRVKADVFAPDGALIEVCRERCRTRPLMAGALYTILVRGGEEAATGSYRVLVEPAAPATTTTSITISTTTSPSPTTTTTSLPGPPPATWRLRHVLRAPERGTPAAFGAALAGDVDRLIVGAPGDATAADDAGAVYVVAVAGGQVTDLAATLHAPDHGAGAAFGAALATRGDAILVGAPGAAGGGAAYLFQGLADGDPVVLRADGSAELGAAVAAGPGVLLVGAPGVERVERFTAEGTRLAPLTAPAEADATRFGAALAASEELVLVGAPGDGATRGHAYLFEADGGALVAELSAAGGGPGDGFGTAVLIDGDVLVVGAPGAGNGAGRVLRFSDDGTPLAPVTCAEGSAGARLGSALAAASGRTLVGAPGAEAVIELDDDCGVTRTLTGVRGSLGTAVVLAGGVAVGGAPAAETDGRPAGAVQLFDAGDGLVVRRHPIGTRLGTAVDLAGGTTLVGAPEERRGLGAAYGFGIGSGELGVTLDGDDEHPGLGASVAIVDAATWAAGAPLAADGGGRVLVARGGAAPVPLGKSGMPGDQLGFALAARGGDLVAGAPAAGELDTGEATVFALDSGRSRLTLTKALPLTGDFFGAAVALDGDDIAVGAPFDDAALPDAGAVHLLAPADGAPQAIVTSPTPRDRELFGAAIALTADLLIVGAPGHEGDTAFPGRAYVFDRRSRGLRFVLESPASGDGFGAAVAASAEAIAVGAPLADDNAPDAGGVFLFAARDGAPVLTIPNPVPREFANFGRALGLGSAGLVVGAPGAARAFVFAPEPVSAASARGPVTASATASATATCGDGRLDAGEECDDANTAGGDDCEADCTLPRCCTVEPLGATAVCNDRNPCTHDAVDPVMGCSHTPNGLCCQADGQCQDDETCRQCVGCALFPWDCCQGQGSTCLPQSPGCIGTECLDAVACECSQALDCGDAAAPPDVQALVDQACHQLMTSGKLAFAATPSSKAELRVAVRAARAAVRPARRELRAAARLARRLMRKQQVDRDCRDRLLERLKILKRAVPRRQALRACVAQ